MKKHLLKLMASVGIFLALSLDLAQAGLTEDDFGVSDTNRSRAVNSLANIYQKVNDNSLKAAAYWVDLQDFTKDSPTAKIDIPDLTPSYLRVVEKLSANGELPPISDPEKAFRKILSEAEFSQNPNMTINERIDLIIDNLEAEHSQKKKALAVLEPLGITDPSSQQIKAVKYWDDLKEKAKLTNKINNVPKFDPEILESLLYLMKVMPESNFGKTIWQVNGVDMLNAITYLRTDPAGALGQKITAPTQQEIISTMQLRPSKFNGFREKLPENPTLNQIREKVEMLRKAQEVARKAAETQDVELLSRKPVSFNSTFKTERESSVPQGWILHDGRKGRIGEERTEENPLQVKVIGDGKIKITGDMYNFYYPLPELKNFAGQEMRFSAKVKSTVPGTRLAYMGKRGDQINSDPHSNREGEETMSLTFKVDSDPTSLNNLYFLGGRAKEGTPPSMEISDVKLELVGKKN